MTEITRQWDDALHPRGTGAQGGQFVAKGSGASSSSGGRGRAPARKRKAAAPTGPMRFDGKRGSGYGMKGGDPRVAKLQAALNRLGVTDLRGNKLGTDGKFGPLTSSAVKKAQRLLGLKPDGIVTPTLLRRLMSRKSIGPQARKAPPPPPDSTSTGQRRKAAPVRVSVS